MGHDASRDIEAQNLCRKKMDLCAAEAKVPVEAVRKIDPPPASEHSTPKYQAFFLRADNLDNPYPGLTQSPPASQALGASFNVMANDFVQSKSGPNTIVSSSRNITMTGMATYVFEPKQTLFHNDDLDWAASVWLSANGNWDSPTRAFGDTSALKMGPRLEFDLHHTLGTNFTSLFDIAPYFQTDFYGKAQAGGASIGWTPLNTDLYLGGIPDGKPGAVAGFVVLRAEATNLNVAAPGMTNLIAHDYEWLGGAARAYLFFFPSNGSFQLTGPLKDLFTDRLSFIATVQSYRDANSGVAATMYSVAFQYKLTCSTMAVTLCTYGSPSVTVQYDNGTDRDTLQQKRLVSAKFSYAF